MGLVLVSASALPVRAPAATETACSAVAGTAAISGPTHAVAWRAGIDASTAVFSLPGKSMHITRWLTPADAAWLLVIGRARAADGRCWVQVRLPWRPNGSAGWINADKIALEQTPWRIVVSTSRRTLTLFRAGTGRSHRVGSRWKAKHTDAGRPVRCLVGDTVASRRFPG